MFSIFKSKSKKEKMEEEFQRLMEKSYKLQESDVTGAEKARLQAQHIMQEIVLLERATKISSN